MKQNTFKLSITAFVAIMLSFIPLISNSANAQASIYLESSNSNPSSGQLINIYVKASSPDQSFNAALINLNYTNLEFVNLDLSSSALPNSVDAGDKNESDGTISKSLYIVPGGTEAVGDVTLMNIAFKVKSVNGSISLANDSKILGEVGGKGGVTIAQGGSSLTIAVKQSSTTSNTANTPPKPVVETVEQDQKQPLPSRTTPIPPQTPTNIEAQVQAKSTDKTKPKIIKINHSGFIDDNISVQIQTDEGTKATVLSGNSKESLILKNLSSGGLKKSYFVSLGGLSQSIEQNKSFYYRVEVTDAAGNKTVSDIRQISTSGLDLSISLKNPDGSPIKNQEFTINGKQFKSDNNGLVNLKNVVPGSINISYVNKEGEEVFLGELTAIEGVSDQVLGLVTTKNIEDGSPITLQNAMPILAAVTGAFAIYILLIFIKKQRKSIRDSRLHTANPYGYGHNPHLESQGTSSNPASFVIKPSASTTSQQQQQDSSSQASPEQQATQQDPSQPTVPSTVQQTEPANQDVGVEQAKTIVGDAINDPDKK